MAVLFSTARDKKTNLLMILLKKMKIKQKKKISITTIMKEKELCHSIVILQFNGL